MKLLRFAILFACFTATASTPARSQTMNTGDPVKRGLKETDFPRAKQLAPNVYSYEALRAGDAGGKMTTVSLIVVTNDGSRDQTGEILSRLEQQSPELCLRTVTHEVNRGYGAALASGFDAAGCDLIFLMDSDQQFDASELALLLDAMGENIDLVIGWRRNRADSRLRLLNAWGLTSCMSGNCRRACRTPASEWKVWVLPFAWGMFLVFIVVSRSLSGSYKSFYSLK